MDDAIWSPTTCSKNRERRVASDVAGAFVDAVVTQARTAGLLSDERFPVDSTPLEAWASLKSVQRPEVLRQPPDDPGHPTVDFRGERRSNATHRSTTDPDAQLFRKGGAGAVLSYLGHVVLDNRHGLVVNTCVTAATGTAAWDAVDMRLADVRHGTIAGDKHYDMRRGVRGLRGHGLTPHVAAKRQFSAIDRRTTRHPGSAVSQQQRTLVEPVFGWMKPVGTRRTLRHRGGERVDWTFPFAAAASNLVRWRTLGAVPC